MDLSTRYFVTTFSGPSWRHFFDEFYCRGCGAGEAYRSRPRSFFERYVLPLFLMQAVRCERCCHRSYIFKTIPALERVPSERKQSQSQPSSVSNSDSRVA
jgi:hypothetical protein